MNEKLRVSLGIILWVAILVVLAVGGGIALHRMEATQECSCESTNSNNIYKYIYNNNYIYNNEQLPSTPTYTLSRVAAEEVAMDTQHLSLIDSIVSSNIELGEITGAVVGVVRHGKLAYAKAFGTTDDSHEAQPISLDTRFDIASLSKPIATATAVMQLVEQGKLPLAARIDRYISGFEGYPSAERKGDTIHLRVCDLLAHCSGLPAYTTPERIKGEYPDAQCVDKQLLIEYVSHCKRLWEPRSETLYSCLNYIVLGEVVERITGCTLDEYTNKYIYIPLGMYNTCYTPDAEYAKHCAPTLADVDGRPLRGVAHDPLTRDVMGGVSGNAGLFSTLDDIAIYSAMILNRGEWQGQRILSKRSVETILATPRTYSDSPRALCFAEVGGYSGLFGDLVTDSAVGHSGATGTSLVIDPELDMAIIILSNRVYLHSSGSLHPMRSAIATVAAASVLE